MSETLPSVELDPTDVASWAAVPFEQLLSLPREEVEEAQLEAVRHRFEQLRPGIAALDALATRQGVDRIESVEDAAPLLFDHRVYKSYPMSIIEKRQFDRLTQWLRRLTTHDLTAIPLDGVTSVDGWIERLDEHGMIMLHSTGTTGKLSFLPRSRSEWPGWTESFFDAIRAATGVDRRKEALPSFYPGYRTGNTTGTKMQRIFGELSAEGEEGRHCLYEHAISSDLLSLAARMRTAEERGELDQLDLDPQLLEERKKLIEAGRRRDAGPRGLVQQAGGGVQRAARPRHAGSPATSSGSRSRARRRASSATSPQARSCSRAAASRGCKDAPEDWEQLLRDFYGIDRISSFYGMTECMGYAPLCTAGFYHFFPYTIPMLLDPDGNVLPREGVQTGRCAFVDLLAESYWGGFITGDRITVHWDDDCDCGWTGPRARAHDRALLRARGRRRQDLLRRDRGGVQRVHGLRLEHLAMAVSRAEVRRHPAADPRPGDRARRRRRRVRRARRARGSGRPTRAATPRSSCSPNPGDLSDLQATPIDEIIDFLAELGPRLALDRNPLMQAAFDLALEAGELTEPVLRPIYEHFPSWFRRDLLEHAVETNVGKAYLDGWVEHGDARCADASPRGWHAPGARDRRQRPGGRGRDGHPLGSHQGRQPDQGALERPATRRWPSCAR